MAVTKDNTKGNILAGKAVPNLSFGSFLASLITTVSMSLGVTPANLFTFKRLKIYDYYGMTAIGFQTNLKTNH